MNLKAFWNNLPHSVKTILVIAEGGASGALLQIITDPQTLCFSRACLRHYVGAVITGAIVAVRMYYRPAPQQPPLPPPVPPDVPRAA